MTLTDQAESINQADILYNREIITHKHWRALVKLSMIDNRAHVTLTLQGWRFTVQQEAYQNLHRRGYVWSNQEWVKR